MLIFKRISQASIIFFWRYAVFLLKCPEKMVVSSKTAKLVYFMNGFSLFNVFFAEVEPGFDNVGMRALSGQAFKLPADMVSADEKFFFKLFQAEFFRQMFLNIKENIIHYDIFFAPAFDYRVCANAGTKRKDKEHGKQIVFIKRMPIERGI